MLTSSPGVDLERHQPEARSNALDSSAALSVFNDYISHVNFAIPVSPAGNTSPTFVGSGGTSGTKGWCTVAFPELCYLQAA
ncbi:MAG: hypothetical protein ACYDGY_04965 [Acidimicrobiales bacterium]